jgi:hypothetical protein
METAGTLNAPLGFWQTSDDSSLVRIATMSDVHLLNVLFFLRRGAVELHALHVSFARMKAACARRRTRDDANLVACALHAVDPWQFLDTIPKYQEIESEVARRGLL